MPITGSNQQMIDNLLYKLEKEFKVRQMGVINIFLGIQVKREKYAIFFK